MEVVRRTELKRNVLTDDGVINVRWRLRALKDLCCHLCWLIIILKEAVVKHDLKKV
jgi:hypothetical protein